MKSMKPSMFLASAGAILAVGGLSSQPAAAAAKTHHAKAAKVSDWTHVVSTTPAGGFVMGNPEAAVKLVEYGSMTCPHCRVFEETAVPQIISGYVKTGKISFEFRNYVRDPTDVTASLVARCAGAHSFFPVTRAMFEEQADWEKKIGEASPDELKKIDDLPTGKKFLAIARLTGIQQWAAAHGVPEKKSTQCLTSDDSVNKVVAMANDVSTQFPNFPGTPSFLINGELVDLGPVTEAGVWPALEAKIDAALAGSAQSNGAGN